MYDILFGARAQVVVGITFLVLTGIQTYYWLWVTTPNDTAIFIVSMEALAFASYAIIATGLGYRKTEHVETAVVENIEQADEVDVKGPSPGSRTPER